MKLYKYRVINKSSLFLYACIFLWMLLIYLLSAQNGAQTANTSLGMATTIAKVVYGTPSLEEIHKTHMVVRKLAHVAVFFVLGSLIGMMCTKVKGVFSSVISFFTGYVFLIFCSFYDEWHKQFIDGRHNEAIDVMLNIIGCTLGLGCVALVYYIGGSLRRKKQITK